VRARISGYGEGKWTACSLTKRKKGEGCLGVSLGGGEGRGVRHARCSGGPVQRPAAAAGRQQPRHTDTSGRVWPLKMEEVGHSIDFKINLNLFKRFQNRSNFDRLKKELPNIENFEIKYGFAEWNNFLHRNVFRFEMYFELKNLGSQGHVFYFRKLNKIARSGLKSRNLHGRRKSNWEHFSCWELLPIINIF
jgi:hypothetical protein